MDFTEIVNLGYPRCARCEMPVEEFSVELENAIFTFTARCHGEIEVVTMTVAEIESLTELEFGSAFADPRTLTRPIGVIH